MSKKIKRSHLRIRMRNSLHGQPIAIPRNVDKKLAAHTLANELRIRTPIDTGNAMRGWETKELSNGDMRVINEVKYIRRLALDGTSKQARRGFHNDAIREARKKINVLSLETK